MTVRIAVRIGIVLVVVVALFFLGALLYLKPLVESEEFRAQLSRTAREQIGREIGYASVDLGMFPPHIEIAEFFIEGPQVGATNLLAARRAALYVSLPRLAAGEIVLRLLRIEGAVVHLSRDASGWSLPGAPEREGVPSAVELESDAVESLEAMLFPGLVSISESRIVVEDRRFDEPARWTIDSVRVRSFVEPIGGLLAIEANGRFAHGGEIQVDAEIKPSLDYVARIELSEIELAGFGPPSQWGSASGVVSRLDDVSGSLSGKIEVKGGEAREPTVLANFEAADLRVEAFGVASGGRVRLDVEVKEGVDGIGILGAEVDLETGGRATLSAGWENRRPGRASIHLEDVSVVPLMPLLPEAKALSGRLGGTLEFEPGAGGQALRVDVAMVDSVLELQDVALRGALGLVSQLELSAFDPGAKSAELGRFDLDATDASLDYPGVRRKPPGVPATLSGGLRVLPGGGVELTDLQVKARDFSAEFGFVWPKGEGSWPESIRVETNALDLADWITELPELPEWVRSGSLALESLRIGLNPLRLEGKLVAKEVAIRLGEKGLATLTGPLTIESDAIRSDRLDVRIGGQPFVANGHFDYSAEPRRLVLAVESDGPVDSRSVLQDGLGLGLEVIAPLELAIRFEADAGPTFADTLGGDASFVLGGRHGKGRIPGHSPLRATLESVGIPVEVVSGFGVLGAALPGRDDSITLRDEFEEIAADVEFDSRAIRTQGLRMDYRGYAVDVDGQYRFEEGEIDASGRIVLFPEKKGGMPALVPKEIVVEIARVSGPLGDTRVEAGEGAAEVLAALFAPARAGATAARVLESILTAPSGRVWTPSD